MKTWLVAAFILICGVAIAAERVSFQNGSGTEIGTVTSPVYVSPTAGANRPSNYSGDQQITTSSALIIDAAVYYKGVTVGDALVLYNGTWSSTKVITFYAPTANGFTPLITRGFTCDSGIYMDVTVTGAGIMGLNLTYR